MKDQFVTYEIALAVKELGFNEECLACYTPHLGKGIFELISKGASNEKSGFNERFIKAGAINGCAVPLWQQVIDWFREEHKIDIELPCATKGKYHVFVKDYIYDGKEPQEFAYYEAREQAILKAIEFLLIKNLKK